MVLWKKLLYVENKSCILVMSDLEHPVYFSRGFTNKAMECVSLVEDKMIVILCVMILWSTKQWIQICCCIVGIWGFSSVVKLNNFPVNVLYSHGIT